MPRIRSLKIGLFHNEELCDLSPWHRLLFAGLPLLADKEGRLEDRPRRIKAELFPYDDLDIDVLLTDLARRSFVLRYVADGVAAIAIPNFLKHQRPNNKEAASVIPAPTCEQFSAQHEKDQGEWSLGSGLGNGLGKGEAADGAAGADGAPPKVLMTRAEDLMAVWNTATHPPIARCRELTAKRKRHCASRLKERTLPEWETIFGRIQESTFCQGVNDRKWIASFDWAIGSPDVAVKVLEGKYDNRAGVVVKIGSKPQMARQQVPDDEPL